METTYNVVLNGSLKCHKPNVPSQQTDCHRAGKYSPRVKSALSACYWSTATRTLLQLYLLSKAAGNLQGPTGAGVARVLAEPQLFVRPFPEVHSPWSVTHVHQLSALPCLQAPLKLGPSRATPGSVDCRQCRYGHPKLSSQFW